MFLVSNNSISVFHSNPRFVRVYDFHLSQRSQVTKNNEVVQNKGNIYYILRGFEILWNVVDFKSGYRPVEYFTYLVTIGGSQGSNGTPVLQIVFLYDELVLLRSKHALYGKPVIWYYVYESDSRNAGYIQIIGVRSEYGRSADQHLNL